MTYPECGSKKVYIDTQAAVDIPVHVDRYRTVPMKMAAIVAFCSNCEWAHHIQETLTRTR